MHFCYFIIGPHSSDWINFETSKKFNRILVTKYFGVVLEVVGALIVSLIIPYGIIIWTYFKPKESLLWGRRGIYKEEPEITESAISKTKAKALITIIVYPIIVIIIFVYS